MSTESNWNFYDYAGKYDLTPRTKGNKIGYHIFYSDYYINGYKTDKETCIKAEKYNKYRDVADKGMTQTADINLKKRKNIFGEEELTTTFGN